MLKTFLYKIEFKYIMIKTSRSFQFVYSFNLYGLPSQQVTVHDEQN